MRHPFITAQLLRHARTTIDAEPRKRPAQDAVPGRRVRRLLVVIAATLVVALVALGVPLPAGAPVGPAVERTLAREHHAYPVAAVPAAKAAQRTLAREHYTVPAPTGQQPTRTQPAAPSRTRPLLVVVGVASLMVVLAAAAAFRRLRARPRAAT